jgi:hypothetical protein
MTTLRWSPFPGADVASYKVYRSMIGFRAPVLTPAALSGKTLQLKMNSGSTQTIQFDGFTISVDKINASLTGGRAYPSLMDDDYFLLRSDVRAAPGSIQIVGGTAMAPLGLTAHTIQERSEDEVIAQILADADPTVVMEYEDLDGSCQDWYTVTTLSSNGTESAKAPYRQPTTYTGGICVLEGIVTNLQGVRMPDVAVSATIVKFPQEIGKCPQVTLEPIMAYTGSDGRFSIPLLQGILVQLDIEAVGFSRNITVPAKAYEFITDLRVDLDYRYPLEYNE